MLDFITGLQPLRFGGAGVCVWQVGHVRGWGMCISALGLKLSCHLWRSAMQIHPCHNPRLVYAMNCVCVCVWRRTILKRETRMGPGPPWSPGASSKANAQCKLPLDLSDAHWGHS